MRVRFAATSLAVSGSRSVGDALRHGISVLSESGGSGEARADALILLEHVLGRAREWIAAHDDSGISEKHFDLFVDLCKRRRRGEPVPYITGSAWFYGRGFVVDESVLIPRPETEHLVDEAVDFVRRRPRVCRVLDVGTGSGAIACSIAAETTALVEGTDLSAESVSIARFNAARLGVSDRCRFHRGDLTAPVSNRRFDLVVANLPYVPSADLPQAPDPASFEPRIALDGGPDGLTVYRVLLPGIAHLVAANALALFEAAPPTIDALRELTQTSLPNFTLSIGRDYAGDARYVKALRKVS